MVPPGGSDLYGESTKICVLRVVGTKTNCPSEFVCANRPGWSSTEMVAPWMGFLEVASITVPDAPGETYVVISMQPLNEITSGRATVCRHLPMCGLTVKLSGRPEVLRARQSVFALRASEAPSLTTSHGPLQRLLGRSGNPPTGTSSKTFVPLPVRVVHRKCSNMRMRPSASVITSHFDRPPCNSPVCSR